MTTVGRGSMAAWFDDGARTYAGSAVRPGFAGSAILALWCAFFLLSPVYLMPSGYPQPGDLLILALLPILFLQNGLRIPRKAFPIVNATSLFILYAVVVNLVWTVVLSDAGLFRYPSFFLFNFAVCVVFLSLHETYGRRFLDWTAAAICASVLVQVVAVSLQWVGASQARIAGLFNNPNQAGYFALLCASLFWIWAESACLPRKLAGWLPLSVYVSAAYLAAMSLSRAAIGAIAVLMLLAGLRNRLVLGAGLLVAVVVAMLPAEFNRIEHLQSRVEKKSRGIYEEAMSRGYDRMLNHPQYLVLGAGEGAQYRIRSLRPAEMHSSLGTVLFCYGAVGLVLFLYIFFVMAKGCGPSSLRYFIPVAIFGTTHMGLRQSEFWIMPLMVVCLNWPEKRLTFQRSRNGAPHSH